MDASGGGPGRGLSRRFGLQFSASNLLQAPLTALLEYSGVLRPQSGHLESEGPVVAGGSPDQASDRTDDSANHGEVLIRIIGAGDQENPRLSSQLGSAGNDGAPAEQVPLVPDREGGDSGVEELASPSSSSSSLAAAGAQNADGEGNTTGGNNSSYQRYEIQQVARWIEQFLPFSLLLLVVFIRQHLKDQHGNRRCYHSCTKISGDGKETSLLNSGWTQNICSE